MSPCDSTHDYCVQCNVKTKMIMYLNYTIKRLHYYFYCCVGQAKLSKLGKILIVSSSEQMNQFTEGMFATGALREFTRSVVFSISSQNVAYEIGN